MQVRHRLIGVVGLGLILATVVYVVGRPSGPPASNAAATAIADGSVTSVDSRSPALPQSDDLTLGQSAGKVLIGLTVRPAQPGFWSTYCRSRVHRPRRMCPSVWLSVANTSRLKRARVRAARPP